MTGIIDTGGGLRGIFGSGALDRLLDCGISFSYLLGVSAGAANLATYLAGQRGRTLRFYRDYSSRPQYMGAGSLIKNGSFVDLSYIYETLSNSDGEDPLDYEKMKNADGIFLTVATNALTGNAVYFPKSAYKPNNYSALKASCCLPAICKPVIIDGTPYYDGGVADPIPIAKAFSDGCDRVVLILTRPKTALHNPSVDKKAAALIKNSFPETAKILNCRYELYNQSLKKALDYEKEGKVLIISPDSSKGIGTLTKDKNKLMRLYNEGYEKADKIKNFI
jgi:predicted patatin/cPLA2 family phospholipase